ncbi:hypothetical protein Bca52824_044229 [Brassica carinata]|uniref:Uncharacterized protein n=1 Tax=Brassica carinata TaxID=52824 RepID=A0A8X7S068_BRACI|nr:hypothetical protein Bca52824_044229 [Brassica carinata]
MREFCNEGNILDAKDPKLGTEYDRTEVEMVLKLGLMCSHSNPHDRPTMRQVLHYLTGDAILPDLSPSDLRGNAMTLEIHDGLSETGMFTCGSSMVNSIVSASSGSWLMLRLKWKETFAFPRLSQAGKRVSFHIMSRRVEASAGDGDEHIFREDVQAIRDKTKCWLGKDNNANKSVHRASHKTDT